MKVLEDPLAGFRENPCEVYSQLYMNGYTFMPFTGKLIPNTEFDSPDKQALSDPKYALKILEKAFRADSYERTKEILSRIIKPTADYEPPKTWATELKEISRDDLGRSIERSERRTPAAGVTPAYNTAVTESPATPAASKNYTFVSNTFVEQPVTSPSSEKTQPLGASSGNPPPTASQNARKPVDLGEDTPWTGGTAEAESVEKDPKTGSITIRGGTFKGITFS